MQLAFSAHYPCDRSPSTAILHPIRLCHLVQLWHRCSCNDVLAPVEEAHYALESGFRNPARLKDVVDHGFERVMVVEKSIAIGDESVFRPIPPVDSMYGSYTTAVYPDPDTADNIATLRVRVGTCECKDEFLDVGEHVRMNVARHAWKMLLYTETDLKQEVGVIVEEDLSVRAHALASKAQRSERFDCNSSLAVFHLDRAPEAIAVSRRWAEP